MKRNHHHRLQGKNKRIFSIVDLFLFGILLLLHVTTSLGHESSCGCQHHKHNALPWMVEPTNENENKMKMTNDNEDPSLPFLSDTTRMLQNIESNHDKDNEDTTNPSHCHGDHTSTPPSQERSSPPKYWNKLQAEVLEAIPWVTLGIFVTGAMSLVVSLAPTISTLYTLLLSNNKGRHWGILIAAILGLATPLCSCGALPLASGLFLQSGIPLPMVMTFLTTSQSAGLDSAAVTYGLLGATAVVCRLGGAILLGFISGMTCPNYIHTTTTTTTTNTDRDENDSVQIPDKANKGKTISCHDHQKGRRLYQHLGFVLHAMFETATDILPTVLFGLALSTAALHYLPFWTTFFVPTTTNTTSSSSSSSFGMRLLILTCTLPLQLCEHATVAFAAALQKAGGSPGLAFAFLLSAPAINLPTMLFLIKTSTTTTTNTKVGEGIQALIRVIGAQCLTALAISYMVDSFRLDLMAGHDATGTLMSSLPLWFTTASPYMATILFGIGKINQMIGKNNNKNNQNCCSNDTTVQPNKSKKE